jgi:hypothetical protein
MENEEDMRKILAIVLLTSLLLSSQQGAFAQDASNVTSTERDALVVKEQENIQQIEDLYQTVQQLHAVAPFVKIADDKTSEFDADAAKQAGFSDQIIQLAEETVAFQNAWVARAKAGQEGSPSVEDYPLLKEFFNKATENAPKQSSANSLNIMQTPPPCGDWTYPVPNFSPGRTDFQSSDPAGTLVSFGFHVTAGYACGGSFSSSCTGDYTRGRLYNGPYGTCATPRFRDHGRVVDSDTYNIQLGEPNPEILSYTWPYWNWGSYVQWWHDNY